MDREPSGKCCAVCGAPLLGQQERFCSRECKRKWWAVEYRGTEVRRCINCGNVLPFRRKKFCSARCNSLYYGRLKREKEKTVKRQSDTRYPGTMAEIVEITRNNPNYGRLVKEVLNA